MYLGDKNAAEFAFGGRAVDGFRYLLAAGLPFPGLPVPTPPQPPAISNTTICNNGPASLNGNGD